MPVYMIRAGGNGPVKIGRTANVESRLRNLQISHWAELSIIRVLSIEVDDNIKCDPDLERWLHTQFIADKIRNEWFSYNPHMLLIPVPDASLLENVSGIRKLREVAAPGKNKRLMALEAGIPYAKARSLLDTDYRASIPSPRIFQARNAQ